VPLSQGYVRVGAAAPPIGSPNEYGVIQLPANAVVSNFASEIITTSTAANHVVGQRFHVTIQYWGVCNPYPSSEPVEYSTEFVEIIGKPNPLTTAGAAICW